MPKSFSGENEAAALAEARALPAWSALIERDALLTRRGVTRAIHGRLGAGTTEPRWLYDETEGRGSLAIRVRLPAGAAVAPGDRIVAWGAWSPAGDAWELVAERVDKLSPASGPPPSQPPLSVSPGSGRSDAVPVSARSKPGAMTFAILDEPDRFGDGWLIGDFPGAPPAARLFLPGERRPYGAQSPIASSEQWSLETGIVYEVEIGKFRPARPGSPLVLQALGAPVRLDPQPAPAPAR